MPGTVPLALMATLAVMVAEESPRLRLQILITNPTTTKEGMRGNITCDYPVQGCSVAVFTYRGGVMAVVYSL